MMELIRGDGIMVLLYWKPINWMELSFGVLTWELIFVRALIILLISCMILMVMGCVKLPSALLKVPSLQMER